MKIIRTAFLCVAAVGFYRLQAQFVFQYKVIRNNIQSTYELVYNQSQMLSWWIETERPRTVKYDATYVEREDYIQDQLFKDFKGQAIYSCYQILQGSFYVRDSLNLFKWQLVDSSRTILGYNCLMAKTTIRGRSFTVFYAPDIPLTDGPWKFNGLPGIILRAESASGAESYILECTGIEKRTENLTARYNTYLKNKKFENWENFNVSVNEYVNKYIKKLKSSAASEGETGYKATIRLKNFIEIFNSDLQNTGVTIDF